MCCVLYPSSALELCTRRCLSAHSQPPPPSSPHGGHWMEGETFAAAFHQRACRLSWRWLHVWVSLQLWPVHWSNFTSVTVCFDALSSAVYLDYRYICNNMSRCIAPARVAKPFTGHEFDKWHNKISLLSWTPSNPDPGLFSERKTTWSSQSESQKWSWTSRC